MCYFHTMEHCSALKSHATTWKNLEEIMLSEICVLSHSAVSNSLWPQDCSLPGSSVHGNSPGKNTGVGCHALLQGIFPTQGSNPGLPHCRWILYHLSYQESPKLLEWVAYPFSRGTSWPRNRTRVSCIVDRIFTSWATWEALQMNNWI